ncbi:hypothetical protein ACQ0QQ_00800 [Lysinibacillus sphaericus]
MEKIPDESLKLNTKEELVFETYVHIYRNRLLIRGESNLPAGASVELNLRPYPDDSPLLKLENYAIEPEDKIAVSGIMKVGKDGEVESLFISRPDETKRYRLEAVFDPRKQNEDIQEKYGASGESLPVGSGMISVIDNKRKVSMIQKVININSIDQPNGIMSNLRLASLKELKEANFAEKLALTAVK